MTHLPATVMIIKTTTKMTTHLITMMMVIKNTEMATHGIMETSLPQSQREDGTKDQLKTTKSRMKMAKILT